MNTFDRAPKWTGYAPKKKSSFMENLLLIIFIRGPIAMAIGIILEAGFWMLFGLLLGPSALGDKMMATESPALDLTMFLIFHVIGWFIMWHQFPVMTGEIPDSFSPNEFLMDDNEFVIQHGRFIINGKVYKK